LALTNKNAWIVQTHPDTRSGLYAKCMQIEESFRDLKCDRCGCALHYSLTRARRLALAILRLLQGAR